MNRTLDEAPVEYEGTINGCAFYFRARGDGWFFGVGKTVDAACNADHHREGRFSLRRAWGQGQGLHPASRMPFAEAERIIHECAMAYLATLTPEGGE